MTSNDGIQEAFQQWISTQGGFIHPGLNLFETKDGCQDRGVFAKSDIRKGEQLLLIPKQLTLYLPEEPIKDSDDSRVLIKSLTCAKNDGLSPFLATVLLFLGEQKQREASSFCPYFQILPKQPPPSLITWSQSEHQLLKGTSLEHNVDGVAFEQTFRDQLTPFMQQHPQLWTEGPCSYESALSAAGIGLLIRSVEGYASGPDGLPVKVREGTTLYLIPGIDMVNHAVSTENTNTELSMSQEKLRVKRENGMEVEVDSYFTMTSEKDLSAGEEILQSYGELANAELLRIYGFVSDASTPNPYDYLVVNYATIEGACSATIAKQKWDVGNIFGRRGCLSRQLRCYVDNVATVEFHLSIGTGIPDDLLTVVQLLLLPDEDFDALENESGNDDPLIELGVQYLDESEWSEMVLLTCMEVYPSHIGLTSRDMVQLVCQLEGGYEKRLSDDGKRTEAIRVERKQMVDAIRGGEQRILKSVKKSVLSLMAEDDEDISVDEVVS